MKKILICKKCNNEITWYTKSKLCGSCSAKERSSDPKNHPSYKDGRTLKQYFCINCQVKGIQTEIHW